MEKQLLNILENLIPIQSIHSNTKALYEAVDWVRYYFNESPVTIRSYESNDKPSVVILTENTKHPKLILSGHLDVVEGDQSLFTLRQEGDLLYGRGVFDMKGSDAVMIETFKKLVSERDGLSIGLMLTTDEEIGGKNGVQYLLEHEGYSADVVYLPDGSDNFNVLVEEKGIMHVRLTAVGKAAHGARPWLGENAVEKLIRVYSALKEHFPDPQDEVDWKPSLNLGRFVGGDATNKVPDFAEMNLDFRFPFTERFETIEEKVQNACEPIIGVQYEIMVKGNVSHVDENNEYVTLYRNIVKEVTGNESELTRAAGASDARFFSDQKVPFVISRSAGGEQHTPDEWASLSGFVTSCEILEKYILAIHS